jgi:hypothetical protein
MTVLPAAQDGHDDGFRARALAKIHDAAAAASSRGGLEQGRDELPAVSVLLHRGRLRVLGQRRQQGT